MYAFIEMQSGRWLPYDHRRMSGFEDEAVLSCYLGKIYHFHEGRNAYWGYWSKTYPGDESFCRDIEETKKRIESRRTQGSAWTLLELPIVVLAGQTSALLVGEINTSTPLQEFATIPDSAISIEQLAESLAPRRPNSVVRFISKRELIPPAQLPFLARKSSYSGGNHPLEWNPSQSQCSLEPMMGLITRLTARLQGAVIAAPSPK